MLFIILAVAVSAEPQPGETQYVEKYRCLLSQALHEVRDANVPWGDKDGRYLILFADREEYEFAQCGFERPNEVTCEVASPFYQPKSARAARLPALARLGYDLDASKGNYVKKFKLDDEGAPPLAEFMLRSLYGAFLDSAAAPIRLKAPLVKALPSAHACAPTS